MESISLDSYYFCVFNSTFVGLTKPTFFVSFRLSGKPRSTEDTPVVKGPMDLDLGLTEEKPENRLGSKIGATAASGVTIAVIRGTLLVIRVPVDLEVKEVYSQPIFHFRGSVKVKKKPVVEEKPVIIKKPVVEGWVWRRRTSWVGGGRLIWLFLN